MEITRAVVLDLLPLYAAGECSTDTKALIEEYLQSHPEMRPEFNQYGQDPLRPAVPAPMTKDDELRSLARTRRLLRLRSTVMAFAIFFSAAPFSFSYVDGRFWMLLRDAPGSAAVYGTIGIISWVVYFIVRRNAKIF